MIIFGFRTSPKVEGMMKNKCPGCKKQALLRVVRIPTWFTLFFIPVIPLGNKVALECTKCGSAYELKNEAKEKALEIIKQTKRGE